MLILFIFILSLFYLFFGTHGIGLFQLYDCMRIWIWIWIWIWILTWLCGCGYGRRYVYESMKMLFSVSEEDDHESDDESLKDR